MTTAPFSVAPIDESLDQYKSIAAESLMAPDPDAWRLYVDRIGLENLRGVFDGARLVGGLAFYRMGIWFGGNAIPCAGVSGVAISPVDRGSGACGFLIRQLLRELREEKMPLASLYASTQYLYRKYGFEHAGTQTQYSIPLESLRAVNRELDIHRFDDPPLTSLNFVANARASVSNGNLGRTPGLWQRLLNPYDGRGSTTYLMGDVDKPEGFAILRPGTRDAGHPQPLVSTDVAANTPEALHRLISLVHDHRSMCDSFHWFGPPNDPIHFLAQEQHLSVKQFMRWMLRIIDLKSAFERRGYDSSVAGELHLQVTDPLLPENEGCWVVRVADGRASVERGGRGSLSIDVRALASLYASFYSATELVRLGAMESKESDQVVLADRMFAGPSSWVPELY